MQGEDGLDETRDAGGGASELAEAPPGFEGGDGLLNEGPDLRVGPVDGLLASGERLPSAAVGNPDGACGTLVSLVRPAGDVGLAESAEYAVFAGRPDVRMASAGVGARAARSATASLMYR